MREGWCATCGKRILRVYAAGRTPRRMYCDDVCRYTVVPGPRIAEVGDGLCVFFPESCAGRSENFDQHGSISQYRKGCRCKPCRLANRVMFQAEKSRRAVRLEHDAKVVRHGASAYTNHGCRCDVCKAGKAVQNRRRYQAT